MNERFEANSRYLVDNEVVVREADPDNDLSVVGLDVVTAVGVAFHLANNIDKIYSKGSADAYKRSWEELLHNVRRSMEEHREVLSEFRPANRNVAVGIDNRYGDHTLYADLRNSYSDHPEREKYKLLQQGWMQTLETIELPFTDPKLEELLQ